MGSKGSAFSKLITSLFICFCPLIAYASPPDQGIILYTPYTSQSVTPGKTLTYDIEVINDTKQIQNIDLSVRGIPSSWEPALTANDNSIQEIAIKPKTFEGENTKDVQLKLHVPLKIEKGYYSFKIFAESESGREYLLPLNVRVTEQGTFETEMQVDQANMEGYADSDFNYSLTLSNQTAQKKNYALGATAPPGWGVRFQVSADYVTSVTLKSNESKNISVKVTPPANVSADTSRIIVQAVSGNTSVQDTLETVIKGKYNLELTTPSGRLSADITAGDEKEIKLLLKNTGTIPLHDIDLSSSAPVDWSVDFADKKITRLNPGESVTAQATIQASNKAIAGDYQLKISAENPNASDDAAFRITVSKSITWGSIGILIILAVLGGIAFLFKRYGRR